jgi:hypothetical protein
MLTFDQIFIYFKLRLKLFSYFEQNLLFIIATYAQPKFVLILLIGCKIKTFLNYDLIGEMQPDIFIKHYCIPPSNYWIA